MAPSVQLGWVVGVFTGTLTLGALAQLAFRQVYNHYDALSSGLGLPAATVARQLLDGLDLLHVAVVTTANRFDDRYDLRSKTLYLSDPEATSIAALAVTAHEVGHAWQHEQRFRALRWRRWSHPMGCWGALAALAIVFLGWSQGNGVLLFYGVGAYAGGMVLLLLSLPVEWNANRCALRLLVEGGMLCGRRERRAARRVLSYALFTYLGAALNPVLYGVLALWTTHR